MIRQYILAETNWKYIKQAEIDLAVLPWGATEAHNFHLPFGTDIMESDFIAAESAKIATQNGSRVIVLPSVPYGVNTGQHDIRLDINVNPSTQFLILTDIIDSLQRHGIFKLLVLNSHGGNDFKPFIRELGLKFPKMFLSCCNWFQSVKKSDFFENEGDHADEMETSLMLFLAPHLVLPMCEAGEGKEKKFKIKELSQGWAWAERRWSQVTSDTGVGNPSLSTVDKGEAYFRAVTVKVASLMIQLAESDVNDLYE